MNFGRNTRETLRRIFVTFPLFFGLVAAVLLGPRGIAVGREPERVVSLGPWMTEVLCALGLHDRIVAADSASAEPKATQLLGKVGYFRAVSFEGVLRFSPDLVLAVHEAGPTQVLDQLRRSGVDVRVAPQVEHVEEALAAIRWVGEVVGRRSEADSLASHLASRLAELAQRARAVASRPTVLAVFAPSGGNLLVAGMGTAAHELVHAAGGATSLDVKGWKPLSAEAVAAARPQVLLVTKHTVGVMGGSQAARGLLGRVSVDGSPRLFIVPDTAAVGFGPNFVHCADALFEFLHGLNTNASEGACERAN